MNQPLAIFDDVRNDPRIQPVSLDTHLRAQYGLPHRIDSMPLFTLMTISDGNHTALTVIHVRIDAAWERYQCYAVDAGTWTLIGIWTLYVKALKDLILWRDYIEHGGSIATWLADNPDGWIKPDRHALTNNDDDHPRHDGHDDHPRKDLFS
jgi:hypothetical protein